ncbi:MAG: CDP-alcohol phosphatidyltransferase family protein [Candidatus Hydrothermarchaeales archaeon]
MVSSRLRSISDDITTPIAEVFVRLGLGPNAITLLGLFSSIAAAYMYATNNLIFAFYMLLLASTLDLLDGAVAKVANSITKFGGFLDSVTDRYSDAIILIGIAIYLDSYFLLIFIVLVGTLLVSYSRARAEHEISQCAVGIAERAERLTILLIATLFEALNILPRVDMFYVALVLLAVITHLTVLYRVLYTYTVLSG